MDEGFEPRPLGGWRVRYTYRCPAAKRAFKVYARGELVVIEGGEAIKGYGDGPESEGTPLKG